MKNIGDNWVNIVQTVLALYMFDSGLEAPFMFLSFSQCCKFIYMQIFGFGALVSPESLN